MEQKTRTERTHRFGGCPGRALIGPRAPGARQRRRRVTVADTETSVSRTDAAERGAQRESRGFAGESRACVFHICGGIAMLVAGLALLIAVA